MKEKNKSQEDQFLLDLQQVQDEKSHPERVLFLSVVLQALLDATKPQAENEPPEEELARRSAQNWFFTSVGVTAQDFVDVCDLAGIEPREMRSFAFKVVKSREVRYVRKRINTVLNNK